ncbi:MAG: DUF1552 domain-containing protein [Planctomycetota bacterium]
MATPSRRGFLKGAGALLALPFLESLTRVSAFAGEVSATPPLRMGIFTVTGGTVLESWKMKEAGAFTKLPSILRPLEFAKDEMLLLTGLGQNGRNENLNGHEHCGFLHLTAADFAKKEGGKPFASISVDQLAAKSIGDKTVLPSLEMGLSNQETKFSFRDTNTAVPYEAHPRMVFDRMFRGRQPVVPNWTRRASANANAIAKTAKLDSYDQSVIDLVLSDANSLRGQLGKNDRLKLDEYLQSVRSVETRLHFLEAKQAEEQLDALNPGKSKLNVPPVTALDLFKNPNSVQKDPERHAEYIRMMSDLMVLAFQTDTTRVCTLAVGSDESMFPGVVTVGYERHCHTLEHQGNAGRVEDADPISREACRQIHAWYTSLFAETVRKMKTIDEGGSTLLDNTMMLYTSYMADGGHGRVECPALLVGKAGGTLKTGRQIDYKRGTPVANLYIEMLDRMGTSVKTFGESATSKFAAYDGRLPGLV